ncbi:MAG: hypothetical protein IPN04_11660 [Rhodoferax sp.]|nr:hypothetical protein [Rhodoferax sp.]
MTGTTSATNDSNAANNTSPVTRTSIDAVNDSANQPGGTLGATTNVATNDQFPAGSLFSVVTGGSCANASVSGTGTATYDVGQRHLYRELPSLCACTEHDGV